MPSAAESSSFLRLLGTLRQRWWIVVVVAAACLGGSLAMSLRQTKQYEATASLLFRPDGFSNVLFGSSLVQQSADPARDATTNERLVVSAGVAAAVKRSLHLKESAASIENEVKASSESDADIVQVTVQDTDPARAAKLANEFVRQFIVLRARQDRAKVQAAITDVRNQLSSLSPADTAERQQITTQMLPKLVALKSLQFGNAEVAGTAGVPSAAISPSPKRDAAIALLLGIVLGGALALLLDTVDRRVKSIEEFESLYGTSVLAAVPQSAFTTSRRAETEVPALEAFRMVRNGLDVLLLGDEVRVLAVTSAISAEGKTTVAINLARVLAMGGDRVLLVEADLRRPSLSKHVRDLGDTRPGLTTVLATGRSPRELLVPDLPGLVTLRVLPSGPIVPGSSEMLRGDRMRDVLTDLSSGADIIIIDAPPLLPIADTLPLLTHPEVDATLIVGRVYHTKRDEARRTAALLRQHDISRFGLVVTGVKDTPGYDAYYAATATDGRRRGRRRRAKVPTPS